MFGDSQEETDDVKRVEELERFFHSTDFEQYQARIAEAFRPKQQPAAERAE